MVGEVNTFITRKPRLFYFAWDHNRPTGGQRKCYRHVDILNHHGFEAYALHLSPNTRLTWFENETRVIDRRGFESLYRRSEDYIVLPEDLGVHVLKFPGRKVFVNQNLFYGFTAFGQTLPQPHPYDHPEVVAVITVSEHNRDCLSFAFPHLPVQRVYYGIDPAAFAHQSLGSKRKQIASIPKAPGQLLTLYQVLQARAARKLNALADYEWVFIENRSAREVERILQDSLIFVFLSIEEGLALMPLEAMSAGCLVVAYDCGPQREFLQDAQRFAVADIVGMASFIEEVAAAFPDKMDRWQGALTASRETALCYSRAREESTLLEAWEEILRRSSS
jgi:glycosyltransferase involved in cell wall biosynthesis